MALKLSRSWRDFVPEWEDNRDLPRSEQVSLQYRTMTVDDVFRAQEEVSIDLLQVQTITQQDMQTQKKYWQFMRYLIEQYTQNWKGVDDDGNPLTTGEEVAAAAGMGSMDLFAEIVSRIVSQSMGTETEAKNFAGQSAPESSDFVLTVATASQGNSKPQETAAEVT